MTNQTEHPPRKDTLKTDYPCAVCGSRRIPLADVLNGFNTCEACQPRTVGRTTGQGT